MIRFIFGLYCFLAVQFQLGMLLPQEHSNAEDVDLWKQKTLLDASELYLKNEASRLVSQTLDFGQMAGWQLLPKEIDTVAKEALTKKITPVLQKLDLLIQQHTAAIDSMTLELVAVRNEIDQSQTDLNEILANRNTTVQLASLLGVDNRWFWLNGLIALLVISLIAWHDSRHEFRKIMNGSRAKQLGFARFLWIGVIVSACLTLLVFLFGESFYALLVARNTDSSTKAKASVVSNITVDESLFIDLKNRVNRLINENEIATTMWAAGIGKEKQDSWMKLRESLRTNYEKAHLRTKMAELLKVEANSLGSLNQKRTDYVAEIRHFKSLRQYLSTGLGLGLCIIVGGAGIYLSRRIAKHRRKLANTCPQCLTIGQFETSDTKTGAVVCRSNFAESNELLECGFEIPGVYFRLPKLCFPTLGLPGSGKTHWLAMAFRDLSLGNYPKGIQFEKVKARGTDEIEEISRNIIRSRLETSATQMDLERIKDPVVFNFSDRDRFGKSNLLVNIFDYSGEVTYGSASDLNQVIRQRALDADGYFFFVDPTRDSDEQTEAISQFRQDVRQLKNVTSGSALRVPVALCISKIDLLHKAQVSLGNQMIRQFYKDLAAIDADLPKFTLRNIQAKSDLMKEVRELVWPNWQIENELNTLFGSRVMYFPLTPVGIEEGNNLSFKERTIESYGVVEPILWLLQMNGYEVLGK